MSHPDAQDAANAPGLRWGIIGTGQIAKKFATGLTSASGHALIAVGSRSAENAATFGDAFSVPNRHLSYEALVADPEVDVVYVATPHPYHREYSIMAMSAGKPVLCEKPFALNAGETREMIEYSRQHNVFLMEAMWPRFQPIYYWIREQIATGLLGDVRLILADVGWSGTFNPASRMYDPALGGGILLDCGVYALSLASMILGTPDKVTGFATLGKSNIDEQGVISLGYTNGALASLANTVQANPVMLARICGTDATFALTEWWRPLDVTVHRQGKSSEVIPFDPTGNGFQYEAQEVARCIAAGLIESPIMPLDETLAIVETMDELRAQWGVRYPSES